MIKHPWKRTNNLEIDITGFSNHAVGVINPKTGSHVIDENEAALGFIGNVKIQFYLLLLLIIFI